MCQWKIGGSVSNLGLLGGADIGDLLGEMYRDCSYLCRWNYIEEPPEKGQDKRTGGIFIATRRWHNRTDHRLNLS